MGIARIIFLYGPPGSGKSTVGELLANRLGWRFVDLDKLIEAEAGRSIFEIMREHGESDFRHAESSALDQAIEGQEAVIALGGGALLRPENRALAESRGAIILLDGSLRTLLDRLKTESAARPLLAGDLEQKLHDLLATRRPHYDAFPMQVCTDDKSPQQLAWEIQVRVGQFRIRSMGGYDVLVQENGLAELGSMLRSQGLQNPLVVTDENLAKFHLDDTVTSLARAGLETKVLKIPAGEAHKNLSTAEQLWRGFLHAGLERRSTIIALGGGVIGDLAGFAASTFMRGLGWVAVPTSLLAMVDASLGGKTGFDLPEGKNLIGTFHPPKLVLADPALLATLPEAEFRSGMAEVLKHGIISDPELFEQCRRGLDWVQNNSGDVVRRAASVKINVIEDDPYEKGRRAVLNLGHTVGHAVELVSGFRLRHGEAISMGMVAEARLAERMRVAERGLSDTIAGALAGLHLPTSIPANLPRAGLVRAMEVDKKRSGRGVRFALPAEIGRVELVEVTDLKSVLEAK